MKPIPLALAALAVLVAGWLYFTRGGPEQANEPAAGTAASGSGSADAATALSGERSTPESRLAAAPAPAPVTLEMPLADAAGAGGPGEPGVPPGAFNPVAPIAATPQPDAYFEQRYKDARPSELKSAYETLAALVARQRSGNVGDKGAVMTSEQLAEVEREMGWLKEKLFP